MTVDWKSDRHASAAAKILKKLDAVLKVNPDGSVSLGWEGELDYGSSIETLLQTQPKRARSLNELAALARQGAIQLHPAFSPNTTRPRRALTPSHVPYSVVPPNGSNSCGNRWKCAQLRAAPNLGTPRLPLRDPAYCQKPCTMPFQEASALPRCRRVAL